MLREAGRRVEVGMMGATTSELPGLQPRFPMKPCMPYSGLRFASLPSSYTPLSRLTYISNVLIFATPLPL
jgi:hypothetical protein